MNDTPHPPYQLIVRQRPAAFAGLDELLAALKGGLGMEAVTARQRLLGPGLALLAKGEREPLARVTRLLQQRAVACWLLQPEVPAFAPARLRALEIRPDRILFDTPTGPVQLERGMVVVGVLADLSSRLADKYTARLMAQNVYRGRTLPEVLPEAELNRTILQGQAVFDFYLLDAAGKVAQAVRVLPGRFNIDGLGARAHLDSAGNLLAVVELVKEYAGSLRLYRDYGLSHLPGCQETCRSNSPAGLSAALDSLTRYGWLVSRLVETGAAPAPAAVPTEATALGVAAAAALGRPELGATLAGEFSSVLDGPAGAEASPPPVSPERDLPPPPERPECGTNWRLVLKTLAGLVTGTVLAISSGGGEVLRLLGKYGLTAGILPALAAVVLLWTGLRLIVLKRRIENTPTSKVRSVAMGLVELHGQARRQYALVAPMTQSACVWYRLRKYRKDNHGKWQLKSENDSSHVPFLLDDGTGRVSVAPTGAEVRAQTQQVGLPGMTPMMVRGVSVDDADEKWSEELIYEGTHLYVLGFAHPLRDQRPGLRERVQARLRQLKLDPQALHRYDADGDGRLDETEWDVARSDAEQAALREQLAERGVRKRQEEQVVITRPPQRGLPFIIAEAASEAQLTRKYGLLSLPLLLAGIGCSILALYKFLQFVG